jgi:DNA-binding MarR family transcriptional regulator
LVIVDAVPSPSPDLRLVQEVSRLILAVAERLQDNFGAHAAGLGLTPTQAKVLMALQPGEAVPMRLLAERVRADPSNLTGIVDRLEERGIVRRQPGSLDRRVKALTTTAAGLALRSQFLGALTGDAGPLAGLSGPDLQQLRAGLQTVVRSAAPEA